MGKRKDIGKRIIFGILLLGISIPLIQHVTGFANVKALKGAVVNSEPTTFSKKDWFEGSYQDNTDKYLNDQFGFRSSYVRLHNQIKYSLFGEANARGVIIGKDWYLYEYNYIRAYHGLDFIGDSLISEKTRKLKYIQDRLKEQNKELLIVLAPGKGSFFPEYFPDSSRREKTRTNYEAYLEHLNEDSVHFVDYQNWFLTNKGKTQYPLYAKGGIHWSKYGEMLVADSLLHLLKSTGKEFPDLIIDTFILQDENLKEDYDIGEGMNLIFHTPTYPMAYPQFHFENEEKNKTRVLFVGDSFYWGMFNYGFSKALFNGGQFWFYNNAIYPDSYDKELSVKDINIREEVEKNEVIVLISTDANLYSFANGFIDQLYEAYKQDEK